MNRIGLLLIAVLFTLNVKAQSDCVSEVLSRKCVTFDVVKHGINEPGSYIFTWQFGDGKSADGPIVNHCYDKSGNYVAKLSLLNKETGGYFEDEIALDLNIVDPIRLDILVADSINQNGNHFLKHSLEEDTSKKISSTRWLLDDILVSEKDDTMLDKLDIGQHKLRVELVMSDSLMLCTEKIVKVTPDNLFTYETRFLRDRSHFANDTVIWSGNQVYQFGAITTLESVFFELDSDQLTTQIKSILNANLGKLSAYQNKKLLIGTFTHTEGDFDRNRQLSLSRSKAILKYLQNKGMEEGSLDVADPLKVIELKNTCSDLLECDYLDKNLNRRADIKIMNL